MCIDTVNVLTYAHTVYVFSRMREIIQCNQAFCSITSFPSIAFNRFPFFELRHIRRIVDVLSGDLESMRILSNRLGERAVAVKTQKKKRQAVETEEARAVEEAAR